MEATAPLPVPDEHQPQAAQVLAMAPQITPIADELLKSVGFKDQGGQPMIDAGVQPQPGPQVPPMQQMDGGMVGSETMAADGVQPGM